MQGGGGGGMNPGMFIVRQAQNLKTPAVEATNLLALAGDLKVDGDKITGDLTTDGAKAQLSFGGRGRRGGGGGPDITNPKGTVTFWLTDGKLTKYQTHVTGSIDRDGNPMDMDRTTTVISRTSARRRSKCRTTRRRNCSRISKTTPGGSFPIRPALSILVEELI